MMKWKWYLRKCFCVNGLLIISVITNEGCSYDKPLVPLGNCDTTIVTYSGTIKPIIDANCIRCHAGPDALSGSGIILDNHIALKRQVPQPMLGAIMHTGNVTPMPLNGEMLDACSITKIRKWIDAGAPNN